MEYDASTGFSPLIYNHPVFVTPRVCVLMKKTTDLTACFFDCRCRCS